MGLVSKFVQFVINLKVFNDVKQYSSRKFESCQPEFSSDYQSILLFWWPISTTFSTKRRLQCKPTETRMWANAQRDGRPAENRWRLLFNAAKFG